MAHPEIVRPNIFNINEPLYVLFNHIAKSQDLTSELIGVEEHYQNGPPAPPLFSIFNPEFIYLAKQFTVFRGDQFAQMLYNYQDENGNTISVRAQSLVAVGPPLWQSRMSQENFIVGNFSAVANVDFWEFVGWRLTMRP